MTTINDITDLARILRERPEWADTIRSILLSRELLELPQRLAEYIATTDRRLEALEAGQEELRAGQARLETALAEFMESTNRRLEALEAGQTRLEAGQAQLESGQARLEARQEELRAGQARLETALAEFMESTNRRLEALEAGQTRLEAGQTRLEARQTRLEAGQDELRAGQDELRAGQDELRVDVAEIRRDVAEIRGDLRPLKAAHARSGAERDTRRIARIMNCFQVSLLNSDDLYRMLSTIAGEDISQSDRDSFEDADIVIVAEHRDTGETHYIAVEASFTAHEDDTRRAIRNADYLARSTGQPAHAVVAARHVDPSAEPAFANGRAHWYEIPAKYLEAD